MSEYLMLLATRTVAAAALDGWTGEHSCAPAGDVLGLCVCTCSIGLIVLFICVHVLCACCLLNLYIGGVYISILPTYIHSLLYILPVLFRSTYEFQV